MHRKTFFFENWHYRATAHCTLARIYETTFLFDSFPPVEGEIAPKKNLYPYFLGNDCKFSKLFFAIIYALTGATNDLGLTVKEFWKSVNVWRSYGQEYSVSFFFWLTVYTDNQPSLQPNFRSRSSGKLYILVRQWKYQTLASLIFISSWHVGGLIWRLHSNHVNLWLTFVYCNC